MVGPRVLLYSHDTLGLGHTKRTISIAEAILERNPGAKVLYVTGSPMIQDLRLPRGMDYVKLPSAMKLGEEKYSSRYLELPFNDLLRIRTQLISTVAREFRPAVFLVDHAPIGMSGEILPTLRNLRRSGTRIVLGLRDVIDDPSRVAIVWKKNKVIEMMRRFYDLILVYGMAEFYNPILEYGIPSDVGRKTHFTGYVYKPRTVESVDKVRKRLMIPKGPFVLVTVGSGEDGGPVLKLVKEALRSRPLRGFSAFITTGPMCPDDVRLELAEEEDKRILVAEFVEDLPSVIAASDLVICMGGYNSICELLAYGHRGIVLPRTAPRREQLIRASFLAKKKFVSYRLPNECTALGLREAIEERIADRVEPLPERRGLVELNGARRAAQLILGLVGEKGEAEEGLEKEERWLQVPSA